MNYKKTLNFIGLTLTLIGFTGFLGGFVISARLINFNHELPLGDIKGIVVSKDGRIYLGLGFYGKIQSYDTQGNFLKNWDIDNSGGTFRIDINNDTILVATARGGYLIKYDLDGNRLSQQKIYDIYSKHNASNQFSDNSNTLYKINKGLFTSVSRQSGGQSEKIISMSILLLIFKGPMPAFLFAPLGIMLRFLANKEKITKKINQYK